MRFSFETKADRLFAYPTVYAAEMAMLCDLLNPLTAGIPLGTIKGKDILPEHALALSTQLNRNAFETFDVDFTTAIAYLRREAITLPDTVAKGFVLITYKGYPLGWVKNIGIRQLMIDLKELEVSRIVPKDGR